MHDGGGDRRRTVQALPKIISGLKEKGYRFVTVSEILEMNKM
jgi:peptidoglycan/xylan/chitin deacetylase (PgdA/CDA1 family)